MMNLQGLKSHSRLGMVLPVLLAMLWGTQVAAFQFDFGDVEGSLDTTLSYGLSWRMDSRDKDIIGLREGGNAFSTNFDDGNLNYDNGDLISNTAKVTSDLDLRYNNFGIFVRGTAFYDFENEDGDRARTDLRSEALDLVGSDARLLDAYAWWSFEAGDMPGQIRVGDQVLSWGESTFIQNGINIINPFDVAKLRVPGAELKEGLVPVGMVSASISPTENLTFEAFYQYNWDKVEIDPPGSYWSTNDFVGDGGEKVMLGFGDVPDLGNTPVADTLLGVPRAANVYADDDGQYGIAMRVYAPGLNDTEFGFYFMNYHSRLPVISAWTGNAFGMGQAGWVSDNTVVVAGTAGIFFAQNPPASSDPEDVAAAVGAAVNAGVMAADLASPLADVDAAQAIAFTAVKGGDVATVAKAYATDAYAKTASYQVEYPEDIKLFGVSFNTVLPESGIAIQGEVSHRRDVPLQIDDLELLLATLEPLTIAGGPGPPNAPLDPTYSQFDTVTPLDIIMNGGNSVYIQGYEELDVTQAQSTVTQVFGPTFGADQFVLLGEVAVTYVHDMPSKSSQRYDGPGTPTTGNPNHALPKSVYPLAAHSGKAAESSGVFADDTSWGYRLVGKLDFDNAIGAVTLSPRIAWAHDVEGTSPGPGGNFVEDRRAVTFGLGANYLNSWTGDVSYTNFFGASRYNLVNDRDFLAMNIKYSF